MQRQPARGQGSTTLKVVGGILGLLLSGVLVSTAFVHWNLSGEGPLWTARFSLHGFVTSLPHHLHWLLPFMALSATTLVLRSVQWQAALDKRVPFKERYHLVAIGAFVHNALPGKLGDITRSFLMARSQGLTFVRSLGSVASCKLLEFAALMLVVAAACLGPLGALARDFAGPLRVALVLCLVLMTLMVLAARYAPAWAAWLQRRQLLPRVHKLLLELSEGLVTARTLRGMAVLLLYSLGPVMAPSLGYGLGLQGLGIQGGIWAGPLLLGAIALGQSVVVVPAGMGLYYFATSWTARTLGATPDQAAAFATLTHLGTVVTQVSMGAVSLWLRKVKWKDLRRRTEKAAEAERHVDDGFEAARA